jgi:hypothetical protein
VETVQGFLVVSEVKQRIEFIIKYIEFLYSFKDELEIRVSCSFYKDDKEALAPFNRAGFLKALLKQQRLVLKKDEYLEKKINIYKYLAYECSVFSGDREEGSFLWKPGFPRVYYRDTEELEIRTRLLNRLEHDKVIRGHKKIKA